MIPFLFAMTAATAHIIIPAFAAQGVPGILSTRLPQEYAAALEAAHCAVPTAVGQIGPQTAQAIEQCDDDRLCIARIARMTNYSLVLQGWVSKLDEHYVVALKLVSTEDGSVRKNFEMVHTGPLKSIPDTVVAFVPKICREIDPAWVDTRKIAAEQTLAGLDFDTGAPVAPVAPATIAPVANAPPPEALAVAAIAPSGAAPLTPDFSLPSSQAPVEAAVVVQAPRVAPVPPSEPAPSVLPVPTPATARLTTPPQPPPPAQPQAPRVVAAQPPALTAPAMPKPMQPAPRAWWAGPQSGRVRTATYVGAATTGLAVAIAGGFGASTLDTLATRSSARTQAGFDAAQSTLETRGTASNAVFGLAGVALLSSVVLWFAGDVIFHDAAR